MLYYYDTGKTAAIVVLVSPDPPDWLEENFEASKDYFGNITNAILHPIETVEAMPQDYNDTYEKERIEYMGGCGRRCTA